MMSSWPLVYLKPMLNCCGSCFFKQKKLISLPKNVSCMSDICTVKGKEKAPRWNTRSCLALPSCTSTVHVHSLLSSPFLFQQIQIQYNIELVCNASICISGVSLNCGGRDSLQTVVCQSLMLLSTFSLCSQNMQFSQDFEMVLFITDRHAGK